MKKTVLGKVLFALVLVVALSATARVSVAEETMTKEIPITITVGNHSLRATLLDNATSRALVAKFPLTLPMMNLYGNRTNVLFELSDTIYQYDTDSYEIKPRYILDTERNRDLNFYAMTRNGKSRKYMKEIIPKEVYETRDYIYISADKDDCSYLVEWNKQTGEICSVRNQGEVKEVRPGTFFRRTLEAGWVNDISGGLNFYPDYHSGNNEWIAIIPAEDLLKVDLEHLKKADVKSPVLRDKLVKIIEGLDEEVDNPVLMIVKLKE